MTTINHYQVAAELKTDKTGTFIELTQHNVYGDLDKIYLHPWQLKAIQIDLGLISADHDAAKKIATLERRLLALRERMDTLHDHLCNNSDHKHADLTWEVTFATATLDIANEFCADFEPDESDATTKE